MALKQVISLILVLGILSPEMSLAQGTVQEMEIQRSLLRAAVNGDVSTIRSIVNNGGSIDAIDLKGNTALCSSVLVNSATAYKVLKQNGADVNHNCIDNISEKRKEQFCQTVKG